MGSADVLIAVIGPNWATAADGSGRRRLDEPDDFVRLEVGGALRRDIRVIPVLVGGAKMPDAHELPDDLAGLAGRNGLELTDLQWTSGVEQLFRVIEHVLAMQLPDPTPPPAEEVSLSPIVVSLALGGAAMLAVGLFMRWDTGHSFLQNNFGTALPHGGAITSLAPIGIVLAAVLGGVLVHEQATRAVGVGLLFAAGYAGAVNTCAYSSRITHGARVRPSACSSPWPGDCSCLQLRSSPCEPPRHTRAHQMSPRRSWASPADW